MILKKGTQVKIISGKDKGKTGEILEINRKLEKVKISKGYAYLKKELGQEGVVKRAAEEIINSLIWCL